MMEFKECKWCKEEITEGRKDKVYCNKRCYNQYKNEERRNDLSPLKNDMRALENSFLALNTLIRTYGENVEIQLTEAVQLGLHRKSPCRLMKFDGDEYNVIGNIAYIVDDSLKSLILYKVDNE